MLPGTAAPVSAGVQRTSIAAALWQTTPEDGGCVERGLQMGDIQEILMGF